MVTWPPVGLVKLYQRSLPKAPQGAAGLLVVAAGLSKGVLPRAAVTAPQHSSFWPATLKFALAGPVRFCASRTVAVSECVPTLAPAPTVTLAEKVLSPATASPLAPSSCMAMVPELMSVALRLTVMPVLGGPQPGVTCEVARNVEPTPPEA